MESFFSSTANCLVRWQDLPGSGTPLIFVHGLGCASSYEYPLIATDPRLNKRRAILIDLPGCGYSEKPRDYSYSITDQASVVAELVRYLGLNKCFIYGHSMGGSISIEAAGLITNRMEGLVVSEPNFRPGGGFFSRQICSHSEEEFINKHWKQMIENESGPWAGSLAVDAPWAVWRGASSLIVGGDWLERFIKLPVRKQLIFGEWSLPDDDVDYLVKSGISTVILDDCGHCMSWEQPGYLSLALSNFVGE